MTLKELKELVLLGLVRPVQVRVRKTGKGGIEQNAVEYELTHAGRVMMTQTYASKAAKEASVLERQICNQRIRINLLKPRI